MDEDARQRLTMNYPVKVMFEPPSESLSDDAVSVSDGQRSWSASREDIADMLDQVRRYQRSAD